MRTSLQARPPGRKSSIELNSILLLQIVILVTGVGVSAGASSSQLETWNIMVVPGNQSIFSARARELFNKNCLNCHGADGRAQTPIALKEGVQDLSECQASLEEILRQIHEGTSKKDRWFKMPAFTNRLTEEEIQLLLPLVEAFRPSVMNSDHHEPDANRPRLAGLVNLKESSHRYAIFETGPNSGQYYLLRKNERHSGNLATKINVRNAAVLIESASGSESELDLGPTNVSARANFFIRCFEWLGLKSPPNRFVLQQANLDLVLFLEAQFTQRTVIRSPHLPELKLDLNLTALDCKDAAAGLQTEMARHGIRILKEGTRFLVALPESEAKEYRPRISDPEWAHEIDGQPELYPGGVYANFPGNHAFEILEFYEKLTRQKYDRSKLQPDSIPIKFTTQTRLRPSECAHALGLLMSWHGIDVQENPQHADN